MVSFQEMQQARSMAPSGGANTPKVGYAQLLQQIMQKAQAARQPQYDPNHPSGASPQQQAEWQYPGEFYGPDGQLQMPQSQPPQGAPPPMPPMIPQGMPMQMASRDMGGGGGGVVPQPDPDPRNMSVMPPANQMWPNHQATMTNGGGGGGRGFGSGDPLRTGSGMPQEQDAIEKVRRRIQPIQRPGGNQSPDYLRGLELGRMLRASRGR